MHCCLFLSQGFLPSQLTHFPYLSVYLRILCFVLGEVWDCAVLLGASYHIRLSKASTTNFARVSMHYELRGYTLRTVT